MLLRDGVVTKERVDEACLEVIHIGERLADVGLGGGPCLVGRVLLFPRGVFAVDKDGLGSCCLELFDRVLS